MSLIYLTDNDRKKYKAIYDDLIEYKRKQNGSHRISPVIEMLMRRNAENNSRVPVYKLLRVLGKHNETSAGSQSPIFRV